MSQNKSNNTNISLGNFKSIAANINDFIIQADNGQLKVESYSDSIFRIRITNQSEFERDFSYAVVSNPVDNIFQIEENNESIIIATASVILEISKFPLRLTFKNLKGEIINADDNAFGTSWIGTEMTTYKQLQENEKFIGLGEKNGNLNKRGKAYTHWNTDKFGYTIEDDPLYCSTPFYIGLHHQLAYGLFFDNSHKTIISFGASNNRFMYFSAPLGEMNYYFIHHEKVSDIIQSYAKLTGTMEMPPLWSLGFQQCRYSYYPDSEVMRIAQTFREKDIPCDVIYLDIHYMDDFKVFTWHPERFPNPTLLNQNLKEIGFNTVVILDPGVKTEKGYHTYEDGLAKDVFAKLPDGEIYEGQVWPGWSAFPDYTKEETRTWWGSFLSELTQTGLEGFWNDMNEPAAWDQHIPELIEFDYEGEKTTLKKARNVYGMQMARATFEGAQKHLNNKRPFILTRAGYSGVQRYAAVWTGDNTSSDEHMLGGVRLVNSMGLAGIPFAGYDIGGFAGECTPELYARWISIGAFSPFFRSHSMINTNNSEPWSFGEETTDISRNFIKLRYKLMPYIYSAFYEAHKTGLPISRSLAIDYSYDEKIYDTQFQNQYLFGPSLLICPIESTKEHAKVYLPEGTWYDYFIDKKHIGNQSYVLEIGKETLPIFAKAGSIIPMQNALTHLKQKPATALQLHIYAGADGSYVYYEDDGETNNCNKGVFFKRMFTYNETNKTISVGEVEGSFDSHFKTIQVFVHGIENRNMIVKSNGATLKSTIESVSFIDALSNFDPYNKPPKDKPVCEGLVYFEVNNTKKAFEISLK